MSDETTEGEIRDFGPQPLGSLLDDLGLTNHNLVDASVEQLTHKQVQKARKGRRLTANLQRKVKNALERAIAARGEKRTFSLDELFNYRS